MNVLQAAKGVAILISWFGKGGKPVSTELANQRAASCISGFGGKPCPHNVTYQYKFSPNALNLLSKQWKIREILKLNVGEKDEKLHICERCGCYLKLKIWTPFIHIYSHTSDEQFAKYPEWCWQKQELKQLKPK